MKTPWSTQLREWRKIKKMYAKEAADAIGVSLDTYRGWECGQHTPHRFSRQEVERRMKAHEAGGDSGESVKVNVNR